MENLVKKLKPLEIVIAKNERKGGSIISLLDGKRVEGEEPAVLGPHELVFKPLARSQPTKSSRVNAQALSEAEPWELKAFLMETLGEKYRLQHNYDLPIYIFMREHQKRGKGE